MTGIKSVLKRMVGFKRSAAAPSDGGAPDAPIPDRCRTGSNAPPAAAPAPHRSETDVAVGFRLNRLRDDPPERQPVGVHARRLLEWLWSSHWRGQRELTSAEAKAGYHEMCMEQRLEPRHWNQVANELSKLIHVPGRARKTNRATVDPGSGRTVRKRIYIIPELPLLLI